MTENHKSWAEHVTPDLMPAIEALRESFDDAHWTFGRLTQVLCFARLHNGNLREVEDYFPPLQHAKVTLGPVVTQRFHEMLKLNTPSSLFKGFLDFYIEGVTSKMLAILEDLIAIGRANQPRLGRPHLEWAMAQAQAMIRHHSYGIESWVRDVCDVHAYDPSDDSDDNIFWRNWQAPMLIIMKPSRYQPYEADRVWERRDVETSRSLLKHFSDAYVMHLEGEMQRVARDEAIRLAKEPKLIQSTPTAGESHPQASTMTTTARSKSIKPRPEAGKLDTQEMYRIWQRVYKDLSKKRPDMSDVWYSQQIAKMPIAKGNSASSIRRRMKP